MKSKRLMILVLTILCFSLLSGISTPEGVQVNANPDPVFYLDLLGPNTIPARNAWMTLIASELPKIGIGIDTFDHTGWAQISPRTWGYPGPYPIPTYDEGGYDLTFLTYASGFDCSIFDLFDSAYITPYGDNIYQYDSHSMDLAIANYSQSIDVSDRIYWAEEIQALLYEDLPSIPIVNSYDVYAHDADLVGWDPLLWREEQIGMEEWVIPSDTDLSYAIPATFEDFSPHHVESVYDKQWIYQIYTGLVKRDSSAGHFQTNNLAIDFSTTDGYTYDISIDPDAVWADGAVLNASDVEFSYELLVDSSYGCPDYGYWAYFVDGSSISIISEFELTITFNQDYPFQDNNLALPLMPKHIWEGVSVDQIASQAATWATTDPTKIMGAGPYYLYDYDSGNGIIQLKRNDYYDNWSGITPHFEDIYFEFYSSKENALTELEAGNIEILDQLFSVQLDEVPVGSNYSLVLEGYYNEMAVNMQHPILGTGVDCPVPGEQSANYVRKAIAHTIPRETIVEDIMDDLGKPAVTPWIPIAPDLDDSLEAYEYNLTKAKEYMVLAGFDVYVDSDGDGVSNYDELYVYGSDPHNTDSDGDGIEDGEEVILGMDGFITDPASIDTDDDGLNDTEEIILYFTDPSDNDTDDDLITDGWEITYDLDPLNATDALDDPDQDGLTNQGEFANGTDPYNDDTDGDGYTDGEEVEKGTDPLDPEDTPKGLGIETPILITCFLSAFLGIIYIKKRR